MAATQFALSEDGSTLRADGSITLANADLVHRAVGERLASGGQRQLDLSRVERLDGAGASVLLALQCAAERSGGHLELTGLDEDAERIIGVYRRREQPPQKEAPACDFLLSQIGRATLQAVHTLQDILEFVGSLTVSIGRAVRSPGTVRWRDLGRLMEKAGADGVSIVALITFLLGVIMGLQSANQFQRFGVTIYVADLVGKSFTRELGPLMTAIIITGRSGAAYAAELGTMKVSEEIDALRALCLDPMRFLVLPRVLALALMAPLLTVLADVVGCLGGLVVAVGVLDLTAVQYTNRLFQALTLWDFLGGLVKASMFGVAITLVACQRGLGTRGGAAGVGGSTTSSVVVTLFLLVALDAVFTSFFTALGI